MRISRRHLLIAGAIVLAASFLLVGGISDPTDRPSEPGALDENRLIQPQENGTYIWPYTSRERSLSGRTLAINVIIHGDDERVFRALTEQTSLEWRDSIQADPDAENATFNGTSVDATGNATAGDESTPGRTVERQSGGDAAESDDPDSVPTVAENGTGNVTVTETVGNETGNGSRPELAQTVFDWADAHGSTRYTYIDATPRGGERRWITESYQIHAGNYLGSRHHIRAYSPPQDNWTALQIHREYWDWFRLRHTVTDIQGARNTLESDFIDQPYVSEISREYYGVNRGWNDGWITEITLRTLLFGMVAALSVISAETVRSAARETRLFVEWVRANVRGVVLAVIVAGLYLGVRSAGIFLESLADVDPRAFILVLYPTIAVGLPVVAFVCAQPFGATSRFQRLQRIAKWLGKPLETAPAFGFATVGLAAAFILDFAGIGVTSLPIQLAIHRFGMAVALGLIAAGATRIDERGGGLLLIGVLGWLVGLAMPLFGYL